MRHLFRRIRLLPLSVRLFCMKEPIFCFCGFAVRHRNKSMSACLECGCRKTVCSGFHTKMNYAVCWGHRLRMRSVFLSYCRLHIVPRLLPVVVLQIFLWRHLICCRYGCWTADVLCNVSCCNVVICRLHTGACLCLNGLHSEYCCCAYCILVVTEFRIRQQRFFFFICFFSFFFTNNALQKRGDTCIM